MVRQVLNFNKNKRDNDSVMCGILMINKVNEKNKRKEKIERTKKEIPKSFSPCSCQLAHTD